MTTPTLTTYLKDYQPSAFFIDSVNLTVDLDPARTRVLNKMVLRRNPDVPPTDLVLDGVGLTLTRVQLNGQSTSFRMQSDARGEEKLVLAHVPAGNEPFELEIFTTCYPNKNTALSGLYVSNDALFTQCEAEGFRRITYFLDRPDVMSTYTVTLRADKAAYPVLLCNGNLIEQGVLEDGRHFARWLDPFKKPSYLFALVAGLLVCREQRIRTRSGQSHLLQIYVRPGDLEKTGHAMRSLMASVAWDEARFGLALDLERFMIVAVSDFNMGAMENKGLNIFNTKYVLANPNTATDADFDGIEAVVAHEYFHNWTGNRVTCRDWFQLSLKEGLTVFRDQAFSQDMSGSSHDPSAAAVRRIEDVRNLRQVQFAEDAGPMRHPVRPAQYQEINNFYTATVYQKGAEVVRMMETLVGKEGFAKGMTLYFARHDGQAVTCDDFAQAIADANTDSTLAQNLEPFKRWYSQAGTPTVRVTAAYDATAQTCTITLGQADQPQPLVIPVAIGLMGADGEELAPTQLCVLKEATQTFTFSGIATPPVPSILRGFSAPVHVAFDYTEAQLLTLLAHDRDPFNRCEMGQRLLTQQLVAQVLKATGTSATMDAEPLLNRTLAALRLVLQDESLDAGFRALVLTLPSEALLADSVAELAGAFDPQVVHAVREVAKGQLARELLPTWQHIWRQAVATRAERTPYEPNAKHAGQRALAYKALASLCLAHSGESGERGEHDAVIMGQTYQCFKDPNNMTDRLDALQALLGAAHQSAAAGDLAKRALQALHQQFAKDDLVMDKWFALQALQPDVAGHTLGLVKRLMQHADFKAGNPNRYRALVFNFISGNPAGFHRKDGAGYAFWAECVLALDASNAQLAARLARLLERWSRLSEPYRTAAKRAVESASSKAKSRDVREVLARALA